MSKLTITVEDGDKRSSVTSEVNSDMALRLVKRYNPFRTTRAKRKAKEAEAA